MMYFDPVDVGMRPIFLCLTIINFPNEIIVDLLTIGEFGFGYCALLHFD